MKPSNTINPGDFHSAMKRIAVIGAGSSGLTAVKSCKEEGVDVVCFERNGYFGGLWRYHDADLPGVASIMKTTTSNTSKEMSAFSDFPPSAALPNFMHNSKMLKYFKMYAEKFDLLQHIRYYKEIVKVTPSADYDVTGRMIVFTKNVKDGWTTQEEFDGVMVCTGQHVYPQIPTYPGQERFKGSIVHTHSLKTCENYKDQRVAIVGIGHSAIDSATDCTSVANTVYLSTRRGSWIKPRVGKKGMPWDINVTTRMNTLKSYLSSYDAQCSTLEDMLECNFDHEAYNLKPQHRAKSTRVILSDSLPYSILSGKIIIKGDITRFEENGVVFEGESDVVEVNSVVLATGYQTRFPFIEHSLITTEPDRFPLYKYMFPPHLKYPTLAIIAAVHPSGAIFPLAEVQSRWFIQIFKGKCSLPSRNQMYQDIAQKQKTNEKKYINSIRRKMPVEFISYMDEITSQFGAKPNLVKMAFTDPRLFWTCLNGPCLPYQYRLIGPHPWPGARDAILNYKERIQAPLNTRFNKTTKMLPQIKCPKYQLLLYSVTMIAMIWVLYVLHPITNY